MKDGKLLLERMGRIAQVLKHMPHAQHAETQGSNHRSLNIPKVVLVCGTEDKKQVIRVYSKYLFNLFINSAPFCPLFSLGGGEHLSVLRADSWFSLGLLLAGSRDMGYSF